MRWFTDLFSGIRIEELHSPAARNSLEHFEERIDRLAFEENRAMRKQKSDPVYSYNILIGDLNYHGMRNSHHRLKVFCIKSFKYINLNAEMDLSKVAVEVHEMRGRLIQVLTENGFNANSTTGVLKLPMIPDLL